jgi:UDPglucose 6-dehydrogenase
VAVELLDDDPAGKRVAVLGAAFKPDSDDIRDSPALDVADALHDLGAVVVVHDPQAVPNARRARPELTYVEDPLEALRGAHVVLHLTEWSDYRALDPAALVDLVAVPRALDARNALDPARWLAAGWDLRALGRPRLGDQVAGTAGA